MIDLFSVASSGLNASSQLLNTAGKNVANVNTPGYVRERTYHVTQELGGVGRATTERVIDTFAQDQHRRDVSVLGLTETFASKTNQVDNIFANEANSLSGAMSRFFGALQTATDEPTNIAARQLVLGQSESMIGQFATMENFLDSKQQETNDEIASTISRANELIQNIATLNNQIRTTQFANQQTEPGALKNQLDQSILELAELTSIHTRENGDGTTLINLNSGQSLVLEDGSFNLFGLSGDPDIERQELTLATPDESISIPLSEPNVGGKIGGLFKFRDEVLDTTRREIGQIALSMTDALNSQNRLGMDLDGQLGTNIFQLPSFQSLNYADNSSATLLVNGRVTEGGHSSLTSADYQVTIDAVNAGPSLDVTVSFLNPDGSPVLDTSGNPVTQTLTGVATGAGTFTPVNGGIELEFPNGGAYAVGDQFLMQPTKKAAAQIEVSMTRPEDLALASPFRVESNINNLGDTSVTNTVVTNTNVDTAAPFAADSSAFNGAGGIDNGLGVANAPARIVFTASDTYEVQDSTGAVLTTVAGATDLENIMAQAQGAAGWPFGAFPDYPGYDFSIQGVPQAGDSFDLSFNTNGTDDNRNGLLLSDLQNADTMVRDNGSGSSNLISFQEAYSTIVSDVGETASTAKISRDAADAIEQQSRDLFESTSGVNLDEEAANLIRFQQAYSASARVLSTAQSLFETILSSVR